MSETKTSQTLPVLKSEFKMYLFAMIVAMSSLETGYYYVMVSVIADPIAKYNGLQVDELTEKLSVELSLATSALFLGSLIGSLIYKQTITLIQSENKLMTLCDYVITILCLLNTISLEIKYLTILRFLIGITIGISSAIVPIYLTSVAPIQLVGRIGSLNQLFITVGIAIGYTMGLLMRGTIDYYSIDDSWMYDQELLWRLIVILPIVFCLIRVIGTKYFKFDCLQRHIKKGENEKLKEYIHIFYEDGSLSVSQLIRLKVKLIPKKAEDEEILKIDDSYECHYYPSKWSDGLKQRIATALVLCILNQFCGINAIIFYANQLFDQISDGNKGYGILMSFYLGLFQIIATLLGGAMMDKFGRKNLTITGTTFIVLSLLLGFVILDFTDRYHHKIASYAVFMHIGWYSLSLGPITPTYISQVLEDVSPFISLLAVETVIISLTSEIITQELGIGKVFLIYGIIATICLAYVWGNMIESKGKTRHEMEQEYEAYHKQKFKEYTKVKTSVESQLTDQI